MYICNNVTPNVGIISKITDLKRDFICRFFVISKITASGFAVSLERLEPYIKESAEIYIQPYNWYYMSATKPKI